MQNESIRWHAICQIKKSSFFKVGHNVVTRCYNDVVQVFFTENTYNASPRLAKTAPHYALSPDSLFWDANIYKIRMTISTKYFFSKTICTSIGTMAKLRREKGWSPNCAKMTHPLRISGRMKLKSWYFEQNVKNTRAVLKCLKIRFYKAIREKKTGFKQFSMW